MMRRPWIERIPSEGVDNLEPRESFGKIGQIPMLERVVEVA